MKFLKIISCFEFKIIYSVVIIFFNINSSTFLIKKKISQSTLRIEILSILIKSDVLNFENKL